MAEPLMPCPFCGGGAADHKLNGHAPDCYLMVRFSAGMRPDAEVAAAWNRRAPDAAALREAEAAVWKEAQECCERALLYSNTEDHIRGANTCLELIRAALRAAAAKEG